MEWLGDAHELWCIRIVFSFLFKLDFCSDLQSEQQRYMSYIKEHFMDLFFASCFMKLYTTVTHSNFRWHCTNVNLCFGYRMV